MAQLLDFNYLAPTANRLIPKWAKNWQHPEEIPEFREAFKQMSPDEREKRLRICRRVGWRLALAFQTDDEFERDWFLWDARSINAAASGRYVIVTENHDDEVPVPRGNPLDRLLHFVQTQLAQRMAICRRKNCRKKFYFREPGRHGQKYCGRLCAEIVNRAGKLRCYHESPNSRKNKASR